MNTTRKVDRRTFVYAGLGAAVLVVGGVAVYLATRPPEVREVVKTATVERTATQVQTVEKTATLEKTATATVEKTATATIEKTATATVEKIVTTQPEVTTVRVRFPLDITGQSAYAVAWNFWFNAFNEKNYGKYRASWDFEEYPGFKTKNIAEVQAGRAPEVLFAAPELLLEFAAANTYRPLDDLIKTLPKNYVEDFAPWGYVKNILTLGGKALSMPEAIFTRIQWYNMAIFEKVGIDFDPRKDAPTSPDAMRELGLKLKQKSGGKSPITGQELWPIHTYIGPQGVSTLMIYSSMANWFAGKVIDDGVLYESPRGKAVFNNDHYKKTILFFKKLLDDKLIDPTIVTEPKSAIARNNFADNNRAVAYMEHGGFVGNWRVRGLNIDKVGNSDVFTPNYSDSWDVAISATTKDPRKLEAAWAFIVQGLFDKETVEGVMKNWNPGPVPPLKSVLKSLGVKLPRYSYFNEPAVQALDKGKTHLPQHEHGEDMLDMVAIAAQKVYLGKASVDDALREAEKEFNTKYKYT